MNWKVIIALFVSHFGYSQIEMGNLYEEMPMDSVFPLSVSDHSAIRPAIQPSTFHTKSKISFNLMQRDSNDGAGFYFSPIIDAGMSIDNSIAYRAGLGFNLSSENMKKWSYNLSVVQGNGESSSSFFQPKSYSFHRNSATEFSYTDIRGRVSYSHNKVFNFQTGIDHNFIGEGNRSMLLSDFGKPYPFARIKANFWHFEYMMLYQFFREEAPDNKWKSKYSSSHLISWNATKWLNFGVFETVIFAPKDTTLNRGYDVEYLNPIVFYRPQEYSMGSSDNILLGLQFSAKYKKHTLYGQAILDEFLLSEIRARSKWWGNKYGGQLGIKGRFTRELQHFFYRVESNFGRPYLYSHSSASQNYGNQGYSLAHPYGASFAELLGELKWQNKNWNVKLFMSYFTHGSDKNDGVSYGGDIFKSYNLRPAEYNHTIGQGVKNSGVRMVITAAYVLDRKTNLQFFIENHINGNTTLKQSDYQAVIGIRSCLWNDYRNY